MSDHALSVIALLVSVIGAVSTAFGTAVAILRHCRADDEKRGEDRARLTALERRGGNR